MLRKLIIFLLPFLSLYSKAQLLLFTGPDHCPWSQHFISEVLSQADFKEKVVQEIDLVQIPFADRAMHTEFKIELFPTLILLSPEKEKWAEIPYIPRTASEYALEIHEMLAFKELFDHLSLPACDSADLKELYLKAQRLHFPLEAKKICAEGVKKEKGVYFLLERYAELAETKNREDAEVNKLHTLIKARDPDNQEGVYFRLALIDFTRREKEKRIKNPLKVVKPLIDYVHDFKNRDQANLWRAELLIARYFLNKNDPKSARKHAENSLAAAPEGMKPYVHSFLHHLDP